MVSVAPVDGPGRAERAVGGGSGGESNIRCRGTFLLSMMVFMVLISLTRFENASLIHPWDYHLAWRRWRAEGAHSFSRQKIGNVLTDQFLDRLGLFLKNGYQRIAQRLKHFSLWTVVKALYRWDENLHILLTTRSSLSIVRIPKSQVSGRDFTPVYEGLRKRYQ